MTVICILSYIVAEVFNLELLYVKERVLNLVHEINFTVNYSRFDSSGFADLMVRALISGSSGPGSGPGRGHFCCVLGQDTLMPLPTQGVTLLWTSIPSRGE